MDIWITFKSSSYIVMSVFTVVETLSDDYMKRFSNYGNLADKHTLNYYAKGLNQWNLFVTLTTLKYRIIYKNNPRCFWSYAKIRFNSRAIPGSLIDHDKNHLSTGISIV